MAKAKKIHELQCGAPVADGIRVVFTTRVGELLEWRKAALDWSDPEGVHSMRVASRRLRSAMRDFLPYLPKRSFASSTRRFKDIADALGEVRDQDVAILALEEIEKKAPAEHAAALKQFIAKRKEAREHQRRELKAMLSKGGLKTLETEFAAAFQEATAAAERKRKRATPPAFSKASQEIIRDRLKEFEKRSDGLFKPLDVNALHDLRIAAKRLRYAVELLAPCFPRSIATHAKRVARIQAALGDLHDCDTWILSLGKEIAPARKEKATEQVAAFTWLLNHFAKLRTKHLDRAFARWQEWEAHDSSGKLREALNNSAQPQPPAQSETQEEPALETEAAAETDVSSVPVPEDQTAGEQMRQAL
jgi:CHAD domain-containing protein